jgi:hypothetical protein
MKIDYCSFRVVSRYHTRLLVRSWIFRLFAGVTVPVVGLMVVVRFVNVFFLARGEDVALAAAVPFTARAFAVILLASGQAGRRREVSRAGRGVACLVAARLLVAARAWRRSP